MRKLAVSTLLAGVAWVIVAAGASAAEDTVADPDAASTEPPSQTATEGTATVPSPYGTGTNIHMRDSRFRGRNHWENGFDVLLTDAWERRASNIESPTLLVTAQWNHRFETDTLFGVALGGFPQSMKVEVPDMPDEEKMSVNAYWAGLNLGQNLFESWPRRAVVMVTGGRGMIYARRKTEAKEAAFAGVKFTYFEPQLIGTFVYWGGLEIGALVSYRSVQLEDTDLAENSDLSGVSYGVTFRTQRF